MECPRRNKMKIGRNDPCYCGSGIKYKKCCLENEKIIDSIIEELAAPYTDFIEVEEYDPDNVKPYTWYSFNL